MIDALLSRHKEQLTVLQIQDASIEVGRRVETG
jgi:hypothetical protein